MCYTLMAVRPQKEHSQYVFQPVKQIQLSAKVINRNMPTIIYSFVNQSVH
jgi:hypothetical protein